MSALPLASPCCLMALLTPLGVKTLLGASHATSKTRQSAVQEPLHAHRAENSPQKHHRCTHAGWHPALMPCHYPITAYRSSAPNPESGKRGLIFNPKGALDTTRPLDMPCGRCMGCRLDNAQSWAIRCTHESYMHPQNAFITLTYDDDNLPENYSVSVRPLQLFFKKLRKSLKTKKIRIFGCGEYGDKNGRPHYHALIFNHQFPDLKEHSRNDNGDISYTAEALTDIWGLGLATTGHVTFKSAGYCARYVQKKYRGKNPDDHYWRTHPLNFTQHRVHPEFRVESRRPGIGATWFDKFKSDVFPSDEVILEGKKMPVPGYYLNRLSEEEREAVQEARRLKIKHSQKSEKSDSRLYAREQVILSRTSTLQRKI